MTVLHPQTASRSYMGVSPGVTPGSHAAKGNAADPAAAPAGGPLTYPCPRCHGATYRVPRHVVDRVLCLVVSLRRYRCWSIDCGWEGLLRVKRGASRMAARR